MITLNPEGIAKYLGPVVYSRALKYQNDGMVIETWREGDWLCGFVMGSREEPYEASVNLNTGACECECPYEERCKHVGAIMIGDYNFLPCTPAGIMELIHSAGVDPMGKKAVVIGRSNIVGKPMAMLLLHENATVEIAHSKTQNLADVTKSADILVAAVGKAKFVTADMVKPGAVVIDVGMNRDENGKLCGDVDFESVASKCSFITPVPGGVGPMTISMLMQNTLTAAKIQNGVE